MNALARLTGRLTLPYRRGAEFAAIPLGAEAGGATKVPDYSFAEYRARWGEHPRDVTYVLTPRLDVGSDDLVVTLTYVDGPTGTVALTVPRGTPAGTGLVVPMKPADAALKIVSIAVSPAGTEPGQDAWELTALLGTVAKLTWLLGIEKEVIARVGRDVAATRFIRTTFGAGLDTLGRDMRVPRFPPRPYSLDADTVALWHLDEDATATAIVDATTFGTTPGHPGAVTDATGGAPGKYGTGFTFAGTATAGITVAASPDFDIAADGDATIEAFVHVTTADATPRAILARRRAEVAGGSGDAGWSLTVMDARGFAGNCCFALCDGATAEVRLFGDLSLTDGGFHHVAGILDRHAGRARLFVDGVLRASAPIEAVGAIAPAEPVCFGGTTTGNPFGGTVDEVRLSRVARTTFHPALGEDDDAYRARLKLFRRWVLPTPTNVLAMVNEAAPLPDDPAPYLLIEANKPTVTVQQAVRIVPKELAVGTAIAPDGSTPRDESVAGTPDDDPGFDPALDLVAYASASVDALADPGRGRMQAGMARMLDALVAASGGRIILEHSFDPAGPTALHAVGRALRLRHTTMAAAQFGVVAHQVGFPYVRNLGPDLAVAVASGDRLAITGVPGPRVDVGQTFDLAINPPPPTTAVVTWTIVTPGPARAHLAAHTGDPAQPAPPFSGRRQVGFVTDAPGDLAIRVEYSLLGRTRAGTLTLRIDPTTVADGHALDRVGNADPNPAPILGRPEPEFDPAYLVSHADAPGVAFATPDSRRMQAAARDALDALVSLLEDRGTAGTLTVTQAFVADQPGVESVGRRLSLSHSTLDPGALAALASRCFDYVARHDGEVDAFVRPDIWLGLRTAGDAPIPPTVGLGDPLALATNPTLPAGSFRWSTRAIGRGAGTFKTVTQPTAVLTPTSTGMLMLVMTFVADDPDRAAPYAFEIRLKPELDVPATTIPKAQYDIIMNVLDAFHPVGVEVKTDTLRPHVREIDSDPKKAFPGYSFPNFRF